MHQSPKDEPHTGHVPVYPTYQPWPLSPTWLFYLASAGSIFLTLWELLGR